MENEDADENGQMHWFPFFVKEWIASTALLTLAERGAYITLLAYQWDHGGIPSDRAALARLLGVRSVTKSCHDFVISKFEICHDSVMRNRKLEDIRQVQQQKQNRRSDAAKRGAAARWGGERHANRNATAMRPQSESQCGRNASQSQSQNQNQSEIQKTPPTPPAGGSAAGAARGVGDCSATPEGSEPPKGSKPQRLILNRDQVRRIVSHDAAAVTRIAQAEYGGAASRTAAMAEEAARIGTIARKQKGIFLSIAEGVGLNEDECLDLWELYAEIWASSGKLPANTLKAELADTGPGAMRIPAKVLRARLAGKPDPAPPPAEYDPDKEPPLPIPDPEELTATATEGA